MDFAFGERVNLITGDNGLGKSFVLDLAWWALTRSWSEGKVMVPNQLREMAEFTLNQLPLRSGHESRWTRWDWYKRYWNNGDPDLAKLRSDAPLVTEAVERAISERSALPDPSDCQPHHKLKERRRAYKPRKKRSI